MVLQTPLSALSVPGSQPDPPAQKIRKGLIQRIGKFKSMQREDKKSETYGPPEGTSGGRMHTAAAADIIWGSSREEESRKARAADCVILR